MSKLGMINTGAKIVSKIRDHHFDSSQNTSNDEDDNLNSSTINNSDSIEENSESEYTNQEQQMQSVEEVPQIESEKTSKENKNSLIKNGKQTAIKYGLKLVLKKYRIPIMIAIFLFFVVLLIISLAPNVGAMLDLTSENEATSSDSSAAITGTTYTTEELEKALIYVGDSRTVGLCNTMLKDGTCGAITNDSTEKKAPNGIIFISETSKGYEWLINTASSKLDSELNSNTNKKIVVFNLGVNDLGDIDSYINEYNSIISKHPDVTFYFLSINPVDETAEGAHGYYVKNTTVESVNAKLSAAFGDKYIDCYSKIKSDFVSTDGLHYDDTTYKKIHDIVIEYIKSKSIKETIGDFKFSVDADGSVNKTNMPKFITQHGTVMNFNYTSKKSGTSIGTIDLPSCSCGPTTITMITYALGNISALDTYFNNDLPTNESDAARQHAGLMAVYMYEYGLNGNPNHKEGSCGGLVDYSSSAYKSFWDSLSLEVVNNFSSGSAADRILNDLKQGYLVVYNIKGSTGTNLGDSSSGHFGLIYGYDAKTNNFLINNPAMDQGGLTVSYEGVNSYVKNTSFSVKAK